MIIKQIDISNYKSIKELSIELKKIADKYCFIFAGRNETGKSSILNAIALADDTHPVNYSTDCNKDAKNNGEDIDIYFKIDPVGIEQELLEKDLSPSFPADLVKKIKIETIWWYVSIDTSNKRTKGCITYIANIDDFLKAYLYAPNGEYKLISELTQEKDEKFIEQLITQGYKKINTEMIESAIQGKLLALITSKIPKIIYWKHDSKYLISGDINLTTFKTNPSTVSIPLRNIFSIAGITNISERIDSALKDTDARSELKDMLSESITLHIQKIWPEHKIKIDIDIESTGICKVSVQDDDVKHKHYDMEQRSDGFKQFVSILLNLSVENENNLLKNKIILLDEPEHHLHPSAVKYLRDELLNIAVNNVVFLATHSIYMIDKKSIDRHFKVNKSGGVTNIIQIPKNNPYQEELVYEALGTSIFEHISPNMIIFEGKTDKDIFDTFTNKLSKEIEPITIGTISADGVTNVEKYARFFNKTYVNGYVVVDADNDGLAQKKHVKKIPGYTEKNTFDISDLHSTSKKATLEDLFPINIINQCAQDCFHEVLSLDESKEIIKQLDNLNKINNTGKYNIELFKATLIKTIIADLELLKPSEIKSKYQIYYNFLVALHDKLKAPTQN